MSTFSLTLHAGYRCRHTGECCRNWTVAAEPHVLHIVGVLGDLDGYAAWERACIAVFARSDLRYQEALDRVADATERVRRWLVAASLDGFDRAMRNFLAARVFGKRQSAPTERDLLDAFRMSDLLLLHVVDTQAFARQVMALEGPNPR
jgi:hypothetical protein